MKRKRSRTWPTDSTPRRLPSNHDTQAPLLAIPMHYVIAVAGLNACRLMIRATLANPVLTSDL